MRGADRHQLERGPADELHDVEHGRQVGRAGCRTGRAAAPSPVRRWPRPGRQRRPPPRVPSTVPSTSAVTAAARDSSWAVDRHQDEDRAGEAEQAHPEVAPQRGEVPGAQGARGRVGEGGPYLGRRCGECGGPLAGSRHGRSAPSPHTGERVKTLGATSCAGITRIRFDGRRLPASPLSPVHTELPWYWRAYSGCGSADPLRRRIPVSYTYTPPAGGGPATRVAITWVAV